MNVYHNNGKVCIELGITEAEELRHELSDLTALAEGYEVTEDLYKKLYYQTLN